MKLRYSFLLLVFWVLSACQSLDVMIVEAANPTETATPPVFDGQLAYEKVAHQVSMGPRYPGSEGHRRVQT